MSETSLQTVNHVGNKVPQGDKSMSSVVLTHGHAGKLPGAHEHRTPCYSMYVVDGMFLMLKN